MSGKTFESLLTKRNLAIGAVGVVLLWMAWQAYLGFPEATICQIGKETGEKYCNSHYVAAYPFFWLFSFVEAHDGAFVAFFTAFLVWSTVLLWRATKRLAEGAEAQSRDMQESIRVAAETAKATEANAKALLISARAHIWIERMSIIFMRDDKMNIARTEGSYTIMNWGETPGVAKRIKIHLFRDVMAVWPNEPAYKDTILETTMLLAPKCGETRQFELKIPFTSQDVEDFNEQRRPLIFFGYVEYVDVFDPTIEHRAGFAYRLTMAGDTSTASDYQGPGAYWHYS
jgi:hypothetical protein